MYKKLTLLYFPGIHVWNRVLLSIFTVQAPNLFYDLNRANSMLVLIQILPHIDNLADARNMAHSSLLTT